MAHCYNVFHICRQNAQPLVRVVRNHQYEVDAFCDVALFSWVPQIATLIVGQTCCLLFLACWFNLQFVMWSNYRNITLNNSSSVSLTLWSGNFSLIFINLSWELAALSLNSQGTHRLFQTLPTPINTHTRLRHGTGSHGHNSLLIGAHKPSGSVPQMPPKLFSGPTHGHSLSPLRATHGLRHSATQDVQTHRRQTHKDTHS